MGDLASDSEKLPMEGHGMSSVCKDDIALLEEALPPAGQAPRSCVELHHSQKGTHKQGRDVGSLETEVDTSGSPSSGIKRGKGGDGSSHAISNHIEPKESSTYERSSSFPSTSRLLVSAMKGGRERSGETSPTGVRHVNWAPDVYDPPVTSVDHTVKGHQQRSRSRKKDKGKQKQKQKKRKSRGNSKKSGGLHDAAHNPLALDVPGPSSPEELGLGEVEEAEVLDYSAFDSQEPKCGGGFPREIAAARTCFPAAEAS
ncbi:hypothetical protein CFC21_045110 [Triticum aestivum]|uniref:BRI1-KD interacting protein 130 n=2 Tax=Triticum aestivum TaxID=4565 RepID=A0A9R1FS92_WHEAT|nr:uncharacterized protein LOC119279006 [Triticum dicoccoides]XP_037416314.1 uncharacterized protein LOC119279006 [Triticum dicoccoides]XP_044352477.1 uncharacterized protein LOC123072873 [Triticum aestivum]KAF7034056.1 hypothetical protein CFC21_045110 [Triticum aestivum]